MSAALPPPWSALPLGPGVVLLERDANGVMAFAKPEGALSHPNEPRDQSRSLLDARYFLEGEYYEFSAPDPKGDAGKQRIYLLNRLDSATSGVILAASTLELAREIRAQFKSRAVQKTYQALVFGAPSPPVQMWRDRLAVKKVHGVVRAESAGNIPSEAKMRVLRAWRSDPPLALVQLEPRTGRSHQLRVQCAQRHLPIVGDATYGDFKKNRAFAKATGHKRMFLHSCESRFEYTWADRIWRFTAKAKLPPEFLNI